MPVLSFSVDDETVSALARAQKACGTANRSKVLRLAVGSLLKDFEPLEEQSGKISAVLTVTYLHKTPTIDRTLHEFGHLVKMSTHVHSHRGCAEVLVVEGDAKQVRSLYKAVRSLKEVRGVD